MSRLKSFASVIVGLLRELSDESAYRRHLESLPRKPENTLAVYPCNLQSPLMYCLDLRRLFRIDFAFIGSNTQKGGRAIPAGDTYNGVSAVCFETDLGSAVIKLHAA